MTPRLTVLAALALAACGGGEPNLMNYAATQEGPDEFLVVPAKPLETPPDTNALPPPAPGGYNRADPSPKADAVAALGGNPQALNRTGIPAADSGLLQATARYGVDPTIRQTLAAEDLTYRQRNDGRVMERLFNRNLYYDAYDPIALDQQAEIDRLRAAGVPTSAAPPDELYPD